MDGLCPSLSPSLLVYASHTLLDAVALMGSVPCPLTKKIRYACMHVSHQLAGGCNHWLMPPWIALYQLADHGQVRSSLSPNLLVFILHSLLDAIANVREKEMEKEKRTICN